MKWLSTLLSENGGSPSTMRALALLVVGTIMVNWTIITAKTGALQNLTPDQVGLVLGVLGIKAIQRKFESGDAPASTPTTEPPKTP